MSGSSGEGAAIRAVFYMIMVQLKIVWWILRGIFFLVTLGYYKWKSSRPEEFYIPDEIRFEHTLVCCGSGWGKTQLLQQMILQDLPVVEGRQSSVVVMDSQGDMLRKILHLAELSPRQGLEVEAEPPPPRKQNTLLRMIGYPVLVAILHGVAFGAGKLISEFAKHDRWPEANRTGTVAIVCIVFALVSGAFARKNTNPVTYLQALTGSSIFLAIAVVLTQQMNAVYLLPALISGPFFLGFALRHAVNALVGLKRKAAASLKAEKAPAEVVRQTNLSDRLILIDPNDVENPPCLNLFDFGLDRIKHYEPLEQERLINGAIAMYEFMFGALLGAELTNRQGVIFRYLARLMMVVPNATIYTLMDFLENPETVRQYIPKLDLTTQRFLQTQFLSSGFDTTREQILTRLWGVLSNSALARMFSHTHNKLNLFEAMNNGSLILINTAKDLLKQEGCEIFGRFMVALISQATQERASIAERARIPTFVYIDEAADYLDETIEGLLATARKYRVGVTLVIQSLAQFHRKLEQIALASTSQKWAGGNSSDDAYQLAKEMNCEPEFIKQLQKEPSRAHFAYYARNKTQTAIDMIVPFGQMEYRPKMTSEEYKELIEKNRKRVAAPYDKNLLTQSSAVVQSGSVFDLEEQRAI